MAAPTLIGRRAFSSGAELAARLRRAQERNFFGLSKEVMSDPQNPSTLIVRTMQDVEPILELNQQLYNLDDRGWSDSGEWRRAARIPNVIAMKWLMEEGINVFRREHWPRVAAKLNDPEWRKLRTAPGRLYAGDDRRS